MVKGQPWSELLSAGFPVPAGFAVTVDGFGHFVEACGIAEELDALTAQAQPDGSLADACEELTRRVDAQAMAEKLTEQISQAYDELAAMTGLACAVRSSAVSEDGAGASSAGLYESYLNVRGIDQVIDAVRRCYASLWAERALIYRSMGEGAKQDAMAVVVMGLVPSESSGVAFTAHPVTGSREEVLINSSFGLGEAIVSGRVTPDSFRIAKDSLAVLEREIYAKELAIYPHPDGGGTVEVELASSQSRESSLSDDEAQAVARMAAQVETLYGSPQDVEWGMASGQLYVLQSRPITTL